MNKKLQMPMCVRSADRYYRVEREGGDDLPLKLVNLDDPQPIYMREEMVAASIKRGDMEVVPFKKIP